MYEVFVAMKIILRASGL